MSHIFKDKRRNGRRKINRSGIIRVNNEELTALVLDLSKGGAMLLLTIDLNIGQRFILRIEGFEQTSLIGKVARWFKSEIKGVQLVGVEFVSEIHSTHPICEHFLLDAVIDTEFKKDIQ